MRKVCAKMVPKNLTTEQGCVSWSSGPSWEGARILQSRCHRWWTMNFGVRPRDKTPKSGVAHCKLSPSQESENEQIQNQIDAHSFFFDSQGIIHKESVPPGQTVNQTFYWEVLERLEKRVARVWPGIAHTWMVHHDNAPCHTAVSVNEFLAEKSIPVVHQPPYSPDLSPWDFFLFLRLKNHLKGHHFGTLDNIQKSVNELKVIPAEAFQHCYEQWKQRLCRCVAAQGNYFEGDKLDL